MFYANYADIDCDIYLLLLIQAEQAYCPVLCKFYSVMLCMY